MKRKTTRVCAHCGHDPDASDVIRSVVVDQPGQPVAAPCTIMGCQYRELERLRERLHHEGIEHSECQDALVRAQAEIAQLRADAMSRDEEKRQQFITLMEIRHVCDEATGIDRGRGDVRESGALGAVKALIGRYRELLG